MTTTGWTYPEVDALLITEALDLVEYWQLYPPVHITLSGIVRAFASDDAASAKFLPSSEQEVEEFLSNVPREMIG